MSSNSQIQGSTPRPSEHAGGDAKSRVLAWAAAMLTGIMIVVLLVVALTDPKARRRPRATDAGMTAANRVRYLGQALLIYANQNGGAFPEVGADWEARIRAVYQFDESAFAAPEARSLPPGTRSYFYVPFERTSGRRVLLLEHPRLRSYTWVLFSDGSQELLTREQFDDLAATLTTPDGKPFHPWQDP